MNTAQQLSTKIREVYLDGKWIANTNLEEVLSEVSFDSAMHVYKNLNSIAALTFHLNYYLEGLLFYMSEGELVIHDSLSFDFNQEMDEDDWESLKQKIVSNAIEFANDIYKWSDDDLQSDFYDNKYGNWQRNIEGVIEHSYYHLGQIVLIKKLILE